MLQMPGWNDIADIVSVLAIILSLYTLYITKLRWFHAYVIPNPRVSLLWSQIEDENAITGDVPCLLVECQFINDGARPGKIEDVVVELQNIDGGDSFSYLPFLMKDEAVDVYIEEGEDEQSLRDFSTIWLKPEENRNIFILFKANGKDIPLTANNTYRLSLLYSGDNVKRTFSRLLKWNISPIQFSFKVTEKQSKEWTDHQTIRLESEELAENRKALFRHRNKF